MDKRLFIQSPIALAVEIHLHTEWTDVFSETNMFFWHMVFGLGVPQHTVHSHLTHKSSNQTYIVYISRMSIKS